jgi:hypothetical protein
VTRCGDGTGTNGGPFSFVVHTADYVCAARLLLEAFVGEYPPSRQLEQDVPVQT